MDKKPPFDASHDPASSRKVLIQLVIVAALSRALAPAMAEANPFLAKAGDTTTTVQVVTCAVSGDFIHLYAAMATCSTNTPSRLSTNSSAAAP